MICSSVNHFFIRSPVIKLTLLNFSWHYLRRADQDGEYNGVTSAREYIIFDEVDQLPDMAALQSDFTITAHELSELGIKLLTNEQALKDIIANKPRTVEPETCAVAKLMLEVLEKSCMVSRLWQKRRRRSRPDAKASGSAAEENQ